MRRSSSHFVVPVSVCFHRHGARRHGFTIIELISVMAIIALMVGMGGIPLLGMLSGGSATNRAALNLSHRLELARAYAMANNTYVWIGFNDDATRRQLSVAIVAGNNGTAADLNSADAYSPIARVETYTLASLQNSTTSTGNTDNVSQSSLTPFKLGQGASPVTFSYVIQFSPTGQASIDQSQVSHLIQLRLQPSGRTARTGETSVVELAGLSGQVRVQLP